MIESTTELVDPPNAGNEVETLIGFLDFQRDVLRRKTEGVSADDLARALPPSALTLGGLLKHLALVEHMWFTEFFLGQEPSEPWASVDWDADHDWEFSSAAGESPAYLRSLFDAQVADSDRIVVEALARGGLDRLAIRARRGEEQVNLRWILVHLIEEYARHLGHADLLREAIDGAVGD